jgi:hypothetical protein
MPDTTSYRVEEVLGDPKSGESLRTRQRGASYPTLTEATRAAAGVGPRRRSVAGGRSAHAGTMSTGSITLADVAARTSVLVVAGCGRKGDY